jgi:hypothetical protein
VISSNIEEEISQYFGTKPKPYLIPFFDGPIETNCVYWDLPPQKNEDRPIHLRHQDISLEIVRLLQADRNDPRINKLINEANDLLKDVPVTKKFGYSWVNIKDLLKLDKTMGIRKEWWELHSRFKDSNACIFQGYSTVEASSLQIADRLIVMPGKDQYEFLRINHTRGNNHPIDTDRIIEALIKLDKEYGVVIIDALLDYIEFIFLKPVETKSIPKIRQRLYRLCPGAEELTESIRLGRVSLWWD